MNTYRIIKSAVLISMLIILALSFSACLASGKALTEKNSGDTIDLKTGDEVEIRLQSNPTTGYSWFLCDGTDKTIVSVEGPEFVESKKDEELVGAGGYEVFIIKAVSKGKTGIILNYQRPWEEESLEAFELTISVD